jgi:hypothetical protein
VCMRGMWTEARTPRSNLALEQTEVRLFRWTRMVPRGKGAASSKNQDRTRGAGRRQGGKGAQDCAGAEAGSNPFAALQLEGEEEQAAAGQPGEEEEEEMEMLVADSNYLPYECMQGMCLSFALLPRARVEAALEEPLSICITGARLSVCVFVLRA